MFRQLKHPIVFVSVILVLGAASTAHAQSPPPTKALAPSPARSRLGLDLFGGAGVSWPVAKDSFEAVDLRPNPIDLGGGARLSGLWGGMFLQVAGTHWSQTGDRVFIDDDGTRFPLGIPLDVKATFIDGTLGFKRPLSKGRPYLFLLGVGAGVVRYSETSPFANDGEDLELSKPSYHASGGVEIPIIHRLAAVVDAKYRYIPDLLGDGGASAVLGEESFGGFNASVGLRIAFGGRSSVVPSQGGASKPAEASTTTPVARPGNVPQGVETPPASRGEGVFLQAAPAYLIPDASRTPLTTIEPGTRVKIRQDKGEWLEIEFRDPQFGPRVGWVQRRFVRVPDR